MQMVDAVTLQKAEKTWLKLKKKKKIVVIRKVYKNGVTDSVLDNYRRYLKQ